MMRLLLVLVPLLLAGAIGLYAWTAPLPRADLTYVNPAGIHTLDPARMSWTPDFRAAYNLWEGLTSYHPVTLATQGGAAEWPVTVSDDGLTYTFTIRADARWSNGDPVTADDFIRGWRRAMEPGTAADYAFLLTDYLAGAAEYVQWRHEAVAALTALSRLREGWAIDADQAAAVADHPLVRAALQPVVGSSSPPYEEAVASRHSRAGGNPGVGRALPAELAEADVDWATVHDAVFEAHAAELDARFAAVGLHAPEPNVLVVQLARRCPYLLDLTAFPTLGPIHASIEQLRSRYRDQPLTAQGLVVYDPQWTKPVARPELGYPGLVTNGPYRLADWRFKRRLRMEVNPHFRAASAIACRTVDMLVIPDVGTALLAYEAGEVDFLPALDVPYDHEIARLARTGERPDFHLCVTLATYFFNFNCVSAEVAGQPNPLLDARVRRALSLATDKQAIVDHVLQRGDRVATSFVPPGVIAGYTPPAGLTYDVAAAQALLAEAGYANGAGLPPLELLFPPGDERVCQAVARQWEQALGVQINLRTKESKTLSEDLAHHRFQIARANWYADYKDPTTFLDCLVANNGNNDSGYSHPRYDALLAEAAATTDPDRRFARLREAERLLVEEDCPILPMLHYATPVAIQPWVQGLSPNPGLVFQFRYASCDR